eukprot:c21600_g1_i1 orf=133-1488(-)
MMNQPMCVAFWLFIILQSCWAREMRYSPSVDNTVQTLKLDLRHIDFSKGNATRAEMTRNAVARSNHRLQLLTKMAADSVRGSVASSAYETLVFAGQGAYLTTIAIGTPANAFTAIIDTGSDLTWRQCEPCVSCYPQNSGTIFDPSHSSTYHKALCGDPLCNAVFGIDCPTASTSCTYFYSYGDQSYTSGDLSYDTLSIPNSISASSTQVSIPTISNVAFGCGTDNENSNFVGAGGLLALGQGPHSLPSQLALSQFSHCLQSISNPASTSKLFLGPAPIYSNLSFVSTPIISNAAMPALYYMGLKGISVGGKLLPILPSVFDLESDGSGGTIIDSGTTLTYLAEGAYGAVVKAFRSAISVPVGDGSLVGLDLCYTQNGGFEVPVLSLHMEGGGKLELPAENYFISVDGLFCLAILGSDNLSILGNILLQNLHVIYDRQNLKLSMSLTQCDSL